MKYTVKGSRALIRIDLGYSSAEMVHVCVVPNCSNRSDRERRLSFHCLPLKNKALLKVWAHKIGRKNLPLNNNSGVCSAHFVNSTGRCLRSDEYPMMNLPSITTPVSRRRSPRQRKILVTTSDDHDIAVATECCSSTQTDVDGDTLESIDKERKKGIGD